MELSKRKLYIILSIMMVGAFAGSLTQSLLTSALPAIMRDFEISATLGQWLTTVYIMVLGIATSTTAYLINRFNTKHLFISAMTLFFVGCIISIFAPFFSVLVFSRILQAFGAGILMPLIQVTAINTFPPEEHGKAMGLVGLVVAFGPAIGPTLSGLIVDAYGWRSIFYILGVISFLVISAAAFNLENVGEKIKGRMDFLSAIIYGLAVSGLMLGVTFQEVFGFTHLYTFGSFGIGFFLVTAFIYRQVTVKEPLLQLKLFKSRTFTITTILNIITYWAMMSGTIMMPIYIQSVKGMSAVVSGLVLLPGSLLLAFLSPVTGYLYDKYKARFVSLIGMFLLTIGAGSFVFFSDETSVITVTILYAIRMTGIAFLLMPLTAYGIGTLNKESVPHGTAIVISVRQMIGALGSSILVAVMAAASLSPLAIDINGVNLAFGIQGGITAAAILVILKYIK